jgi:hypothetical protein
MKGLLLSLALAGVSGSVQAQSSDGGSPPAAVATDEGLTLKQQEDAVWKLSISYADKQKKLAEIHAKFAEMDAKDSKALDEACANEGGTRTHSQSIACGDRAKLAGEVPKAIARWKEALGTASVKGDICGPALRIKRWSLHPEKDLADASTIIVGECEGVLKNLDNCNAAAEREKVICLSPSSNAWHNCNDAMTVEKKACVGIAESTGWYGPLIKVGY